MWEGWMGRGENAGGTRPEAHGCNNRDLWEGCYLEL